MKAFLLAAGLGLRLRPLTDNTPKCLLPLNGKPLLGIWLDTLKKHGIEDVLINTHYLAEKVRDFICDNKKREDWPAIKLFHEPDLLGSAGTVMANRDFIGADEDFVVIYADNLTCFDLGDMVKYHFSHNGVLTIGLFRSDKPWACGIVEIKHCEIPCKTTLNLQFKKKNENVRNGFSDEKRSGQEDSHEGEGGLITGFEEKPEHPRSNLANAGIYVANVRIFDYFPEMSWSETIKQEDERQGKNGALDFGYHILPRLVGKMYGYIIDSFFIDIGTVENYEIAKKMWRK